LVQTEYITVGKFGRTHGLDGGIYVTPLTDFPDRFGNLEVVYLATDSGWDKVEIESVEMMNGRPMMKLKAIDTAEQAAWLVNRELAIPREQLMPLGRDQYYVFDLIGCAAVDGKSDEVIGTITDVIRYPANDVYVIEAAEGGKMICPAVAAFVLSVDIITRRVVVDRGGLLADGAG
jgi:16S rRNA processing protein RimM